MPTTKIEWATRVWNPVTGCSPVSAGCDHCYAKRMASRMKGRFGYAKESPFSITVHEDKFDEPLKWRKPQRVFVCSMGDLFHPDVPYHIIDLLHFRMRRVKKHTFMLLTKRPGNAWNYYFRNPKWDTDNLISTNVWLGVSVEDQATADERIPILLQIPAAIRFISAEPLLGPIDLGSALSPLEGGGAERRGVNWVIAGGETGPGARPMHPDWVRSLRDQAAAAGVPFFFKSWGVWSAKNISYMCSTLDKSGKKHPGDILDGKQYHQFPK